jgi:hypothetical protein
MTVAFASVPLSDGSKTENIERAYIWKGNKHTSNGFSK